MTEHVIDVSDLPRDQQEYHDYFLQTELSGNAAKAYELSNAGVGQSGYSISHSQVDLSKRPDERDFFANFIEQNANIPKADMPTVRADIAKKGRSKIIEKHKAKINAALQTAAGLAVVDTIHKANLKDVAGKVRGVFNAAKTSHKAFLNTTMGRLMVADNINQMGRPDKLAALVRGEKVSLLGKPHKLGAPLNAHSYLDYVSGYLHAKTHPHDMVRRMTETANYLGVPALAEAAQAKGFVLAQASGQIRHMLEDVYGGKDLAKEQKADIVDWVEEMEAPAISAANSYQAFRALGVDHATAMTNANGKVELARFAEGVYNDALESGLSEEKAEEITDAKVAPKAAEQTYQSALASAKALGLSDEQAEAFAQSMKEQGSEYWDAALATGVDAAQNALAPDMATVTEQVQAELEKKGLPRVDAGAIAANFTGSQAMGLPFGDAFNTTLDFAVGEARQAAKVELATDAAALKRAAEWSMPGSAPKDNAERKVTSFREEAKIQDELLRGRPDAVKGPQLATTGDWSKYAIDALPEKPPAPPAPAPVPEKKSTAPSKPVPPEIQARRDAVEAGMRTWGFGGSVEGLKAAERQADAAAAQAKVDAHRAEQEKEDANKRRAAAKVEHEEDRRRREEMAMEEQIVSKPEMNKPTLGQEPFQKADPAKRPGPPSQTRLGLSGKPPVGEVRHGAKGVVPPKSAKAAGARRTAVQSAGRKTSGNYKVNEGYVGGTGGNSSPSDKGDGRGRQHGGEGFVPGNDYAKSGVQVVRNGFGNIVRTAGGVVTTGRKDMGPSSRGTSDSRVVCTELVAQGLLNPGLYFLDVRFTEERLSPACVRGYHVWAVPLVRLMRKSEFVTRLVTPVARWRAEEIAHLLGAKPRGNVAGKLVRLMGEPLCRLIGAFVSETDYQQLYKTETVQ